MLRSRHKRVTPSAREHHRGRGVNGEWSLQNNRGLIKGVGGVGLSQICISNPREGLFDGVAKRGGRFIGFGAYQTHPVNPAVPLQSHMVRGIVHASGSGKCRVGVGHRTGV